MSEPPMRVAVLLRRLRTPDRRARGGDLLGRCERAALSTALALRRDTGADVTALAVGTARFEQRALQLALRAGCNRAFGVLYPAVESVDYLGVARVIAAALRRERFDLVICGSRSQDEIVGAVGPAVAELLDVPHLGGLIDLAASGDRIRAVQRSGGKLHHFSCTPPLVACVDEFAGQACRGSAQRDRAAAIVPVELGELELRASELSVRSDFIGSERSSRSPAATIFSGAAELVAQLQRDQLLAPARKGG